MQKTLFFFCLIHFFSVRTLSAQATRADARLNNTAVDFARQQRYERASSLFNTIRNDTPRHNAALVALAVKNYTFARNNLAITLPNSALNRAVALAGLEENRAAQTLLGSETTTPENASYLGYNKTILTLKTHPKSIENAEATLRSLGNPPELPIAEALGQVVAKQGRWVEAYQLFQQESSRSQRPVLSLRLGFAALGLWKFEEAENHFEAFLKSGNDDPTTQTGLGQALYGQGKFSAAETSFRRGLRFLPDDYATRLGLAHSLLGQKQWLLARNVYDALFQEDTSRLEARLGRAVWGFHNQDFLFAWKEFAASQELLNPNSVSQSDIFLMRGFTLLKIKRPQQAVAELEIGRRLQPKNPVAYAGLSEAYIALGRFRQALSCLDQALLLDSRQPVLLANRGNLFLQIGRPNEAAADFRRASELAPQNAAAKSGLATAALYDDKFEEALVRFDSLVRRQPDQPVFRNNRGIARAYLGQKLEKNKQTKEAERAYRQALDDFQAAFQADTSHKFYQNNVGNVLALLGETPAATRAYESYQSRTSLNNLAVLLAQNAPAQSQRYFNQLIALDSSNGITKHNRSQLFKQHFRDSANYQSYLRDGAIFTEKDITKKYSRDGYLTTYLFDYQFDTLSYKAQPILPNRPDAGLPTELFPLLNFLEMNAPPPPPKNQPRPANYTYAKGKPLRPRATNRKRWGSTICPRF